MALICIQNIVCSSKSGIFQDSHKRKRAQNKLPICWYFTSRRHTKDVCKSPTANIKWSDQWYLLYSVDKREIGTDCKDHIRLGKVDASVLFLLWNFYEIKFQNCHLVMIVLCEYNAAIWSQFCYGGMWKKVRFQ